MSSLPHDAAARREKVVAALRTGTYRGEELAARAGVSMRTLYRYVSRLKADGVGIVGQAGFGYGLRQPREGRHG